MKKGRMIVCIYACLFMLLAGCGKKEYKVEYGIDGYVYIAKKLQTMEGVDNLKLIDDYLYYMQDTDGGTAVARVPAAAMAAGGGGLDFSKRETLAVFSNMTFELPEGTEEGEIVFLSALDGEVKKVTWNSGIDSEKRYGRLSLEDYAVASDGTVCFYLSASAGEYYSMNIAGGVLCRQNSAGEQINRVYLPEIQDYAMDTEGRGMVLTQEGIRILDWDGNYAGFVSTEEFHCDEKGLREELFADSEGRTYYSILNAKGIRTTYEITEENGFQLENAGGFLGEGYKQYSAAPGGNVFQFAADADNALYLYDRKTDSRKKILNWLESGLFGAGVSSVAEVTPDILLISYSGVFGGQSGLYQLTKTSVEDLPKRELLIVASPNHSFELQKAAMLFNASNDIYRIVLESYGAEFSEEEGWVCPQLDAALVSSNPPDILNLDTLNIVKYARKGVLEDLTPYVEDSSIDLKDIPENILEGLTYDGKLVTIPLTFDICCVGLRTAQAEDLDGWTMENVYQLTKMHPESIGGAVDSGYENGRQQGSWLLGEFCARYYLERFIDWEKWECSFDSDEFREVVEWAGKYGYKPEHTEVQIGSVVLNDIYIPEEVLMVSQRRTDFTMLAHLEMQYGEEVCLKGYPTADGRGYYPASLEGILGINTNSAHKEAAWEFMEYYLQVNLNSGWSDIHASKTEIRKLYEKETTPDYIGNTGGENGEPEMRSKGYLSVGSDYVPYYVIPKEQADVILNVIETADFTPMSEEEEIIIRIVVEEAESYFSGNKNLEEVTALIQNRAQLLLMERKPVAVVLYEALRQNGFESLQAKGELHRLQWPFARSLPGDKAIGM